MKPCNNKIMRKKDKKRLDIKCLIHIVSTSKVLYVSCSGFLYSGGGRIRSHMFCFPIEMLIPSKII